ncbi:hypothetical protein RND81_13G018000 [Saponaria officinalis]|uniref:Tobamovirus multiplication protein 2B n=1 Tax=Saponaria officinalis TaxID=3572 RepID=A0AAW1GVU0_SAPOF
MAAAAGGSSSSREGTAKSTVAEQISQAIQSTSNLLHLMQHSSPSQAQLAKLPKKLMAKTDTVRNTGQVLQQLPLVIASLDAYTEHGLHRFHISRIHSTFVEPHLKISVKYWMARSLPVFLSFSHWLI